jgi:hypothetical protein
MLTKNVGNTPKNVDEKMSTTLSENVEEKIFATFLKNVDCKNIDNNSKSN